MEYWLAPLQTRVTSAWMMSPCTSAGSGAPLGRLAGQCTKGADLYGRHEIRADDAIGGAGLVMRLSLLPAEPFELLPQDLQHHRPQPFELGPVDAAVSSPRRAAGAAIRRADFDFGMHLVDLHWHGRIPPWSAVVYTAGIRSVWPVVRKRGRSMLFCGRDRAPQPRLAVGFVGQLRQRLAVPHRAHPGAIGAARASCRGSGPRPLRTTSATV